MTDGNWPLFAALCVAAWLLAMLLAGAVGAAR